MCLFVCVALPLHFEESPFLFVEHRDNFLYGQFLLDCVVAEGEADTVNVYVSLDLEPGLVYRLFEVAGVIIPGFLCIDLLLDDLF